MRLPALLAGLALLVALPLQGTASAREMQAPGSRIKIELPSPYEPSNLFHGFIHPIASISFVLLEVPVVAYEPMARGFTAEALGTKGITEVKSGKLDRPDEHVYMTGVQNHPRGKILKHILLIRDANFAGLITANVPASTVDGKLVNPDDIVKALKSARLVAEPAPSKDPYKFGYLGPFKEAGRLRASAKLYTEDGSVIPPKPGAVRNAIILAPSINQIPIDDIADLSKRAWSGLQNYQDMTVTSEAATKIGGLDGHLILGTAKTASAAGPVPVLLRQLMLKRKGGGYYRLIAIAKADEAARLGPEFDKILASFTPLD